MNMESRGEALGSHIAQAYAARTPKSAALATRAGRRIPGGVNRGIVHFQPHPVFFDRGEGPCLVDIDGNRYVDCIGNYTTMVIGHNHPEVVAAIERQLPKGTAWSGGTADEIELADQIAARMPSIEAVKFTASGTEATMLAVRAARAFTGRPLAAKFEGGYHGLHDVAMVSLAPPPDRWGPADRPANVPADGIPEGVARSVLVLPFNDAVAVRPLLREHARDVACILVEPVQGVAGIVAPEEGFLAALREAADEIGCLLIFDEVISFRLAFGGAQEMLGVKADLTTLGKIIGGGFPIGAIGGRRDVMDVFAPGGPGPKVTLSGTFHANPVALAAGIATLAVFDRPAIEALNRRGARLVDRLRLAFSELAPMLTLNAVGSLFNVHCTEGPVRCYRDSQRGDRAVVQLLYLALLNEGVLLTPRGMGALSTVMTDADEDALVAAFRAALPLLARRSS
ncbi:MAG TPA: aspartate aminotransferase family protein [Aestuariivirgaceae bacterium]|nr:aspartate aminotransferase family protein [Aestuariivirgaceae bacterium]